MIWPGLGQKIGRQGGQRPPARCARGRVLSFPCGRRRAKKECDVSKSVRSPLGRPRQADPARVADRQRCQRGHARGPPRAAGSGRGTRGRARLHRQGEGQGRRPERGQVGHARPDGGQDRARRAGGDAGLGRRAHRSGRPAAGRDHAGRTAGLRQDHHDSKDRAPADHARQEKSADGLARRAPTGRARAAPGAGRADPGRHTADRRRADAAADRQTLRSMQPASVVTTWCCSTRPDACTSTKR